MDNKIIILWLSGEFLFDKNGSFRKFNKLPAMSNVKTFTQSEIAPLNSLDEWEEDVLSGEEEVFDQQLGILLYILITQPS